MQSYGKTLKRGRIFPIFSNFAGKINNDMKYYEVIFTIEAPQELMQATRDVLSALAGEAGFETFEDTERVSRAMYSRLCSMSPYSTS